MLAIIYVIIGGQEIWARLLYEVPGDVVDGCPGIARSRVVSVSSRFHGDDILMYDIHDVDELRVPRVDELCEVGHGDAIGQ